MDNLSWPLDNLTIRGAAVALHGKKKKAMEIETDDEHLL